MNSPDGSNPYTTLALSGANLYGTTYNGGLHGGGTVFKLTTNGTGHAILHSFTGPTTPASSSDGGSAQGGPVL